MSQKAFERVNFLIKFCSSNLAKNAKDFQFIESLKEYFDTHGYITQKQFIYLKGVYLNLYRLISDLDDLDESIREFFNTEEVKQSLRVI